VKIIQLEAQGFRSLKRVTWKPGDLNVVIGPNGTGKSNLLRLLELISISAQGHLGRYIQSAGGMEPLVWDGQWAGINLRLKTTPLKPKANARENLTYELNLHRLGKSSAYRIEHELLGNFFNFDAGLKKQPLKLLERNGTEAKVFNEKQRGFSAPAESILEEETLLSIAAGPFTYNRLIPPYQDELSSWCVYHDFHVDQQAVIRQPAVARLEKRVSPDGQNLTNVIHTLYTSDRDFKHEINAAMRAAFGQDFDELIFPPAADQRIQLRLRWKSLKREQSAADLSDGTLRFLFLLTVLASPESAPLIAIDEPETGLHPAMLPIVAEYAVEASRKSQVIFTTHSPQFLDSFKDYVPTTTVASWENGETSLLTKTGEELTQWLSDYSLGELFNSGDLEAMG